MKTTTMVALATGALVAAVPAVASATMAYVTVPRSPTGTSYVMVSADDGTQAVRVAPGTSVAISPDGARIAYQAWDRASDDTLEYVRDLATGETATLAGACDSSLTWSPDSTMVACTTVSASRKGIVTGNGLGIARIPASLAGITTIPIGDFIAAPGNGVAQGVAFSPDSSRIAFSWTRYGSAAVAGTLFVAPVTDSTARVAVLARASGPVWSTHGIAVGRSAWAMVRLGSSRTRVVHTQVWTISPDLTTKAQVTHYRARGLMSGPWPDAWSPDGATIVGGIGGEDVSDMATFRVPGGATRMLQQGMIFSPVTVSADGQRVLYEAGQEGGTPSIKVMGIGGKGVRTLVSRAMNPSVTANWNG